MLGLINIWGIMLYLSAKSCWGWESLWSISWILRNEMIWICLWIHNYSLLGDLLPQWIWKKISISYSLSISYLNAAHACIDMDVHIQYLEWYVINIMWIVDDLNLPIPVKNLSVVLVAWMDKEGLLSSGNRLEIEIFIWN